LRQNRFELKLVTMITIRSAIQTDARFIAKSQIEMARESESLILDIVTVAKGVSAVFANPAMGGYIVAESDGKLVGCALTLYEWSDWRNGNVIWIHSVYVVPELRRAGVFRTMYGHLKEKVSRDTSLRGLRLYVERKNEIAQKVYESIGMSKEHYEMYEWLKS
jgi:GNAT superfamily N-acetyltransferase